MYNDYYVYCHRRMDNNEIFYVGKGRKYRAYEKHRNKTKKWIKINEEANGHIVEILFMNLTNKEAILKEIELLNDQSLNLVNVSKNNSRNKIPIDELKELIYYDESSPSCFRWKVDRPNINRNNSKSKHDIVGSRSKEGRYRLKYKNIKIYMHRLVWAWFNGDCDSEDLVINHIDLNKENNKIENLELVSHKENTNHYFNHKNCS